MVNIIITADDCGLSQGIDNATSELYEAGMVSAASIMPNFPQAKHTLRQLGAHDGLELGVHLTLSDGFPLTSIPANTELTRPDGQFRHQFLLYALSLFPSNRLKRIIRDELKAQIEIFAHAQRNPTHLTTHCHFHVFPAIREIVHELAEAYKIRWVRSSDYRSTAIPYNLILTREPTVEQPPSFFIPDYLVSLKQWLSQSPQAMLDEILTLDGVVELIVHPGQTPDTSYPEDVRYSPEEREIEANFLREFVALWREQAPEKLQLVNFHQSAH
jgi:predicted glycoside hydrolase/deacetylase ChbG (UPF0249 family)